MQLNVLVLCLTLLLLTSGCAPPPTAGVLSIRPAVTTEQVAEDPDDPAVWVNPAAPERSLIIATVKVEAPKGALVVFDLNGKIVQTIGNLARPNNVDVEYGLNLAGKPVDIAVTTERHLRQLRVYGISAEGRLSEVTSGGGIPVFAGQSGEGGAPMGIALYKRPVDGAVFAIVSPKTGPRDGYLWQYRLEDDGTGKVRGVKVRQFGRFSGTGEIEAIAVDDALGYVYYADEGDGIHKYHADPDHPNAGQELAHFGRDGFRGDREGIGVYARDDGTGYVLCTDQIAGNSEYRIFRREGKPGSPHDHSEVLKVVSGGADSTDGIEVVSTPLGPNFPNGLMVVMNSSSRNFLVYRWEDLANTGEPKLLVGRR